MAIDVETSDIEVIEDSVAEVIVGVLDADVVGEVNVVVEPQVFTVCNDNIYIVQRNADLPQWFQDLLDNQINGSALADEVSDLSNTFTNFEDGVTLQIGYLQDADTELAYDLSVLKVSNDTNTAGISNLDQTRITDDEAYAISQTTIASWQNDGAGGAWFDSQVSTVSNVAYSAAKSASTLTASLNSQQDTLTAIAGDIDILQSQVDGVVETWFGLTSPVNVDGSINTAVEPYATWLADNGIAVHTGDTFVHYELDVNGNKNILATYRFTIDPDTSNYAWQLFTDDLASTAYQAALNAQATADGKINTFYQSFPPSLVADPTLGVGDLWLDSDDGNKMYRYDGTNWVTIDDQRITASVDRLDEATVTIDGTARAKSSLDVVTSAGGQTAIAGYVLESDGGTSSSFNVYANNFVLSNTANTWQGAPFVVNTTTNKIDFTGSVTFSSVGTSDLSNDAGFTDDTTANTALALADGAMQANELNTELARTTTVIDGARITTGTIDAQRFEGNSVWVNGWLRDVDFNITPNYTTGFQLKSNATGTYSDPNIYGAYIRGGTIYGTTLEAATINTGVLNADLINSGSISESRQVEFNGTLPQDELGARWQTIASIQFNNSAGVMNTVFASVGPYSTHNTRYRLLKDGVMVAGMETSGLVVSSEVNGHLVYSDAASASTYTLQVWRETLIGSIVFAVTGIGRLSVLYNKK